MRKYILSLAVMLISAAGVQGQAQKVAFVNSQIVLDTLPEMDSVRATVQKHYNRLQQDLVDMESELEKAKAALDQSMSDGSTSAVRKELMQKSYQNKVVEYQNMQQVAEQELMAKQKEAMLPLTELVKKAIADVAKAKGYTMVMENANGVVLYNLNNTDDITGAVIKHMLTKPAGK
jgi:outer membrane protein